MDLGLHLGPSPSDAKSSSGLLSSSLSNFLLGGPTLAALTEGLSHMTFLQSLW